MKFSALIIASLAASSRAFAPSRSSAARPLSAATLEAPTVSAVVADAPPPVKEKAVPADMGVEADMGEEKDWPVDEQSFVKDSDRVQPGRYNDVKNSIAIPYLPRPPTLDGSHAGDYGFDPLGLSEKLDFYAMQESELRHARLAMLAVVGWPASELLAPDWMLQDGCAPSVLNGVNPLSGLAIATFLAAAGYFEFKTSLRATQSTPMGKMHRKDMSAVWRYGVAGDYNWDPLNLYSSCGDDYKGRKGLRDVEVSHGRMAMLGITYFVLWEAVTGRPIVEDNMLFHPNLLFPALVAAYAGWSQIYEVSPLHEYPIELRYTSEGKMKLQRLQNGIKNLATPIAESTANSKSQIDELDERFGIFEKIGEVPKTVEKVIRSTYKYW